MIYLYIIGIDIVNIDFNNIARNVNNENPINLYPWSQVKCSFTVWIRNTQGLSKVKLQFSSNLKPNQTIPNQQFFALQAEIEVAASFLCMSLKRQQEIENSKRSEVLFPTGDPRDFPFAIHTSTKHGKKLVPVSL